MPKKYSIKMVDGFRFDFVDKDDLFGSTAKLMNNWQIGTFRGFPFNRGTLFVNKDFIVSILETEVDA